MVVTVFLLLFLWFATRPACIEEINRVASMENLSVRKERDATPDGRPNVFHIKGRFLDCIYECGYALDPSLEKIAISLFPQRGVFAAAFRDEKVVMWVYGFGHYEDVNECEEWLFRHLLATMKNAVMTSPEVTSQLKREAIP